MSSNHPARKPYPDFSASCGYYFQSFDPTLLENTKNEGWLVSECDDGYRRIQKYDDDPQKRFASDTEAWLWVQSQASEGGMLHKEAMKITLAPADSGAATTETEEPHTIKLMAPTGVALQGTSEVIPGVAQLGHLQRGDDGRLDYDWNGETEALWDGQQTIEWRGQMVFVDEDGHEWLASQLIPTDTPELPAAPQCLNLPNPNDALAMLADAQQLLIDLCEWDARMGNHEAPVWERARDLRDRLQLIDQGPPPGADTRGKEPAPYDAELERLLRELK